MEILLVEDNPADVRLMRELLHEGKIPAHLSVVTDGEQALDFLYARGKFVTAPRPNLVLLDFNLPKRDGREVLEVVKNDPRLRRIPIIVLTTSRSERDIRSAYDRHANAFVSKPSDLDDFARVLSSIEEFWFNTARLPTA